MASLPIISQDRFSLNIQNVATTVSLSLTRVSSTVISGHYQVGRRTKNTDTIKFYLNVKARRPMVWVMRRNRGVTVPRNFELALQNQAKLIIDTWKTTRTIINNPTPVNRSSLDLSKGIYISKLLTEGHLRRPCVKKLRKTNTFFLCHAAIINQTKVQNPAKVTALLDAKSTLNVIADAYAAKHSLDSGNFSQFMAASLPSF